MRMNRLGDSELNVSEICVGTMTWDKQNTQADAYAQLDYAVSRGVNFIEGWYNPQRRHSSLGYLSPVQLEKRHGTVA